MTSSESDTLEVSKMKKLLSLLLLGALVCAPAHGRQGERGFKLGLIGGLDVSSVRCGITGFPHKKYRLGLQGGLLGAVRLSQIIALRSGIRYAQQGAVYHHQRYAEGYARLNLDYWQVPLLISVGEFSRGVLFLGLQVSYLAAATLHQSASGQTDLKAQGVLHTTYWAVVFGTDFELDVGVIIGFRQEFSLTDVARPTPGSLIDTTKNDSSSTQFYVGYNLAKLL